MTEEQIQGACVVLIGCGPVGNYSPTELANGMQLDGSCMLFFDRFVCFDQRGNV